jgi:hypothetical protein
MTPRNIWRWIAQRFYGALDNIIATLILTGVAYLIAVISGLLPGIVIPGPVAIPLVIVTIIMLPVLILVVVVLRLSQKKAIIIRPIRLREPSKPLDFERLGFSQYIEPDPLLVDNTHRFLLIQQTYLIDGHDGAFVLRYHGKNATNQISRCFRDSVVGDSAADTSLMAIKVVDKDKNVPLRWKLLKDEPYEKLIEIYFLQPLNFGDEFDIEISCRWPGTFTRREDYVFYPIHYYKHGVKKLIGELILNAAPNYVEGIRFDGGKAMLETVQPQIQRRRNKFVVTWEIENPKYIYILQYGRQDI